jgi:hypothetical protein
MPSTASRLAGGAALAGLALAPLLFALPQGHHHAPAPQPKLGNALIAFEPNAGRGPAGVDFYARLGAGTIAISPQQTRLTLAGGKTLATRLVGSRDGDARTHRPLRLRVNSYLSRDPKKWRAGIPTFGGVSYRSVYPGIDLHYHGRGPQLEYDFVVKPGADPRRIALDMSGAGKLRLDRRGNLVAGRTVRQLQPVAYQQIGGARQRVAARFVLRGNRVRFAVGAYNRARPLVIDPILAFSDVLSSKTNGAFNDTAYDVAVDGNGNAFVVGYTWGDGSIPPGDPSRTGAAAFVLKLAPDGTRTWITYIAHALVTDVALGPGGDPYVMGQGFDGMPTKNADDNSFGGGSSDAAVGRLNGTDGTTTWLTYLGGTTYDVTGAVDSSIDVDGTGNAYVGGSTGSTGLQKGSVLDSTLNGDDGFLAKYDPSGSRLLTTYIGGTGADNVNAVAVDPSCQSACAVFIGGMTFSSSDFPITTADFQHGQVGFGGGNTDGFAAMIKADFSDRQWATFYGGGGDDAVYAAAVISGISYPVFAGKLGANGGQATDQLFLHQYTSAMYNGFDGVFGGNGSDVVRDMDYKSGNNFYVVGDTSSTDFPTVNAVQRDPAGGGDAFVMRFNLNFIGTSALMWSTYLGGGNSEQGYGVAGGLNGDIWVAGQTISGDFPLAGNRQGSPLVGGFVSRIALDPVTIDSGPTGTIRVHEATFKFSTPVTSPGYSCRLSPAETAFTSCVGSGQTYTKLADGTYTFEVRVTDTGGSTSRATTREFTVDTRPIAMLTVSPNPALVGRPVTLDASASSGAGQALAKFEWDLDGDGSFERDTGTAATTTETYNSPQDHPVGVRVTDAVGAVATQAAQLKVNASTPLGSQFGVTINNGAQFTRTPNVTVTANFPASTTSLLFSNDGGFLAPSVFPPAKSIKWKLDSSGPERLPKQIYVRFLAGTIPSETFQDDIILDETPPTVQQAVVTPAAGSSQAAARAAAKPKWKLRVKAKDSNSGVARIQVTANKKRPGKLLRYKRRLTVKSAQRPKWVRARDRAGNYSRWRRAR